LPKAVGIKLVDMSAISAGQSNNYPTYVEHLVQAQTQLPYDAAPYVARTIVANQDRLEIEIWEQAGALAGRGMQDNHLVSNTGYITGLGPLSLPQGSPVHINFQVDAEGTVTVHATEPRSGNDVRVEGRIALLSQAEVEKAKANVSGMTAST
jgi:molecular chaperone DnaK